MDAKLAESLFDSAGRRRDRLPPSLPEHVRETLERQILAGELAPGQRVTEDGVAAAIGVSRTPVREALLKIEAQGLVVRRRGHGIVVADLVDVDQARVLYEVRAAVEPFLAARAADRTDDELMGTLDTLQARYREVVADEGALELPEVIRLDSDVHWTIYHHAESDLISIVAQYWGRIQRELYARVYRGMYPKLLASQHDDLLAALAAGAADAAARATREHIWSGWRALRDSFGRDA